MVTSRFLSVECKFQHDEKLRTEYTKFINEYIEMELIIKAVDELVIPKPYFYLPHHTVLKSEENVFGIFACFRKHQYVVTSVIEKMFRQVRVSEDDWNQQRILWIQNPKVKLRTYELTTVTYGTTPASFLATQCLAALAEEVKEQYPEASKSILRGF
eukprot:XP_008180261.1 PREDICTED: uncharacterized protein LOC103308525 [Acyrthosiphon pisum]